MKRVSTVLAVAVVGSLSLPVDARAQLNPTGLACDYLVALTTFNPDATDCLGAFSGNDANQVGAILDAIEGAWGMDVDYLGTTDEGKTSGPFSFVPGPDANQGWLVLDSSLTGDYVLALKAGNSFSLYQFLGLTDVNRIYYTTIGTGQNGQGNAKGISHASLFGPRVSVPEPGTMALLATGIAGLAFTAARRRKGLELVDENGKEI